MITRFLLKNEISHFDRSSLKMEFFFKDVQGQHCRVQLQKVWSQTRGRDCWDSFYAFLKIGPTAAESQSIYNPVCIRL